MLKIKVLTVTPEGSEKNIAVLMEKRVNEVIEKENLEIVDVKAPSEISVSGFKAVLITLIYKVKETAKAEVKKEKKEEK